MNALKLQGLEKVGDLETKAATRPNPGFLLDQMSRENLGLDLIVPIDLMIPENRDDLRDPIDQELDPMILRNLEYLPNLVDQEQDLMIQRDLEKGQYENYLPLAFTLRCYLFL